MCREIPVGQTLWGVAMWEDVGVRMERYSIYIEGLTNAYKWKDDTAAFKPGDRIGTGRTLARKTLKINFWCPADLNLQDEKAVRVGIPDEVDYEWVYR